MPLVPKFGDYLSSAGEFTEENMYHFDQAAVSLESREIYVAGKSVPISTRAFDILEVLIAADGKIVSKDDILRAVWPRAVVVDNNIQVHISALRKLLGGKTGWIRTIPGRGYCLTARRGAPADIAPAAKEKSRTRAVLIGRERALAELQALLAEESMLTLIGPGGVGKTALAQELARSWVSDADGEVCYIDAIGDLTYGRGAHALRVELGLSLSEGVAQGAFNLDLLRGRGVLLIVDGCERLSDHVAALFTALSAVNPHARMIATSREPLRLSRERLFRVSALATPLESAHGDEVLESSAVQLFLKRAQVYGVVDAIALAPLEMISTLCRRLDGLPLALEIAAQYAAIIGVEPLIGRLDGQVLELSNRFRRVVPHHRAISASLAWSYDSLNCIEQTVLRRLAIFDAAFELDAVCAIASCVHLDAALIRDAMIGLVSKSLVTLESDAARRRYTLMQTTRAFAWDKLLDAGETDWIADKYAANSRDARYLLDGSLPLMQDTGREHREFPGSHYPYTTTKRLIAA